MRIGIDAKWYFTGPISTRVILQNLLPELIRLYPQHEWMILLDKKDRQRDLPFRGDNIRLCYIWADNNMLSNVLLAAPRLQRLKVDVILFQTFPSLQHSIPSVAFIHDVLFRSFPEFFSRKERLYFLPLTWLTRNRASRLIATTHAVAGDLLKYRYVRDSGRIDLVPLAVSQAFKPLPYQDQQLLRSVKEKFHLPDRYLLYAGRLNIRKNIENLLRAIPGLQDKTIKLVIIGKEDSKAPNLRRLLSSPDVKDRIIMTGSMTDDELVATYAMAGIFCFPSYAEGFGLPPLEAMASGVPAIVSETTSLPEVCGSAAIYIDPARPDSITRAIDMLLTDPGLYARQRQAGLERAGEYTWTRSAHAVMNSLNNAVKNKTV